MFRFYLVVLVFLTVVYLDLPLVLYKVDGSWVPLMTEREKSEFEVAAREFSTRMAEYKTACDEYRFLTSRPSVEFTTRSGARVHTQPEPAPPEKVAAAVRKRDECRMWMETERHNVYRLLGEKRRMPQFRFDRDATKRVGFYGRRIISYRQPGFCDTLFGWIVYYRNRGYWPWLHAAAHIVGLMLAAVTWLLTGLLKRQLPKWLGKAERSDTIDA